MARVALVTGGTRGIGAAISQALKEAGRQVVASYAGNEAAASEFTKVTGIPISNYDGSGGFAPRDNLAGLNLTTVPKVLIECVNMRNATDAARLVKPAFQRLAARSMADAIVAFLSER